MKTFIKNALKNSYTYTEYLELFQKLVNEGSSTSIPDPDKIKFTSLNFSRIKRLDKVLKYTEEETAIFRHIEKKQLWLVILESWCADGAQVIPVLNKIAETSENIELKIILRDENLDLMSFFLTNGSLSIPKLIILDENLDLMAHWGPRPKVAAEFARDYKEKFGKIDETFKSQLQLWYNKDRGQNILQELVEIEEILEENQAAAF